MPKMKSHKGAKKRFKVTGSGKVMRRSKNLNHFLEKKSSRRKRRLSGETALTGADAARVKEMLSS
ncbi:MAG: 50S ribosomal protein L35 [Acidimicrobiales bacterium]